MSLRRVMMCACLLVGACTPLSPTPPFHFMETAQVLKGAKTSATFAAGAGNFKDIGGGIGVAGRARIGLGASQEVGADLVFVHRTNNDDPTAERPWLGQSTATLAKVGWKLGIARWFAVSAGFGFSSSKTGNAIGGDVALHASTPRAYGHFRPYTGVRGGIAVPVGRDHDEAGGTTKALVVALGSAYELSEHFHLMLEIAEMNEWNRGYESTTADPNRAIKSEVHPGGYLAVGGVYLF